jgi:hypothetical protein
VRPVVQAMERVGEGTGVWKEADREEVGDLVQLAAGRGVIVKVVQLVASPETKRAKRVELSLLPSREPSPQLRNQARARTPRILSHFALAEPLSQGLSSSVRDAFGVRDSLSHSKSMQQRLGCAEHLLSFEAHA